MINLVEKRKALLGMYNNWATQLDEKLLSNNYSNPYYVSIPDNWFDDGKIRIMVVGEEGAGNWGCGKTIWNGFNDTVWHFKNDIESIQDYNRMKTDVQLGITQENKWYNKKNSKFWARARSIKSIDHNIAIIWNNLDKIHKINATTAILNPDERKKLHNTDIKVLAEEIKILEPMIVIFCGWNKHEIAIKAELLSIYNKFFNKVNGKYECEQVLDANRVYSIYYLSCNGITYILTKHPQRQSLAYESKVLDLIKNSIKS